MQRIIQIKPKKGKRQEIADPSFFLSVESPCIKKCNLWEQLLRGKKGKIMIKIS